MTTTAIVVLVLSLVVVWGGLVLSILNLRRAPQDSTDPDVPADTDDPGPGA
ncbi:hypothetical protein Sked_01300 [Sanguibacter keddieii DSM 10542]|uniref:Methionine and alanine importer, small subunit n=1 Tax=Sanguibacter keddieii (strain ATCC 51767 / DSM 10542 / NCFB 3025 / ST-74) TaxID=446469 RepID=D1BIR0_SANKS|nr:methionine/alanine import family NSS transporter small subunit [Sanguibacter keddieii]ACZ20102.1 hypothetical protein Sked_01300 [Sanguibacter keddieii DSM 10542]